MLATTLNLPINEIASAFAGFLFGAIFMYFYERYEARKAVDELVPYMTKACSDYVKNSKK